jgi:predicted dehydrogenase
MKYSHMVMIGLLLTASCTTKQGTRPEAEVRLITLDPGHFHAALVQKTSYPQVSNEVFVYAPDGDDLTEHLKKIAACNSRAESPTQWDEKVYTGADFEEKMLQEKKGNVVALAGNNGKKTNYIRNAVSNGLNVLADKPMAINTEGYALLKECFEIARTNNVLLYDVMTERFEVTTMLQRALSRLPAVYGEQQVGRPDDPAVTKVSVHHFYKAVSGDPLIRPAWFFDTKQQGEGIVDVTTHLVDLVQWACFPEQIINPVTDIELLDANHRTTALAPAQFREVTGQTSYPDYLQKDVRNDTLYVYANGDITYRIKGVCAKVSVTWNYTYPEGGGDTHYSVMKGSKAHLVIEQGKEQNYKPALYIKAAPGTDLAAYEEALADALPLVSETFPGVGLQKVSDGVWLVDVPASYHNGHEAHFGQVMENFLKYMKDGALPEWEAPNMLAKYYVTTQALELARRK